MASIFLIPQYVGITNSYLIAPLVEPMRADLLTIGKIHTDDTPVPVLAKDKTKQGRLWVYVADGVNCHPCTIYDYKPNRSQAAPQNRKIYLRNLYRKFRRWLLRKQKTIITNTPIAKAFNYAINHWRALQNVIADGRLEIDNNIAERVMRFVAIGRKNWMLAGSDQGGHSAAILYSILESAKQNGLNSYIYLSDLLAKIPNTSNAQLFRLLPYHYKSN